MVGVSECRRWRDPRFAGRWRVFIPISKYPNREGTPREGRKREKRDSMIDRVFITNILNSCDLEGTAAGSAREAIPRGFPNSPKLSYHAAKFPTSPRLYSIKRRSTVRAWSQWWASQLLPFEKMVNFPWGSLARQCPNGGVPTGCQLSRGTLGLRQPRPGAWGHCEKRGTFNVLHPSRPLSARRTRTLHRGWLVGSLVSRKSQKTLRLRSIVGTFSKDVWSVSPTVAPGGFSVLLCTEAISHPTTQHPSLPHTERLRRKI